MVNWVAFYSRSNSRVLRSWDLHNSRPYGQSLKTLGPRRLVPMYINYGWNWTPYCSTYNSSFTGGESILCINIVQRFGWPNPWGRGEEEREGTQEVCMYSGLIIQHFQMNEWMNVASGRQSLVGGWGHAQQARCLQSREGQTMWSQVPRFGGGYVEYSEQRTGWWGWV